MIIEHRSAFKYTGIGVFLTFAISAWTGMYAADTVVFSGNTLKVISDTPPASTGLDRIYVLDSTTGVSVEYSTSGVSGVKWYRYSVLGGGYAEEISGLERNGNVVRLPHVAGDMGYIIEDNSRRYCFWVVDYSAHRTELESVSLDPDMGGCSETTLRVEGNIRPINYYTVNGRQAQLGRGLELRYMNLSWDDTSRSYVQSEVLEEIDSSEGSITLTPPSYCQTDYTLSGDRFLKAWGMEKSVISPTYDPVAVEVRTAADQIQEEQSGEGVGSNRLKTETDGLGGSAPAEIEFSAWVTDATIFKEWQMSADPEFGIIDYRFPQQDLSYTFRDEGTWYVRFVGANSDGSCQMESDVYTVTIGASDLLCPNVFSPDGDGVNDVWKVAYRSLLEFECWIFDRYGVEMAHFDNPDKGWDGTYGGKAVKTGVYYYVIRAKGADGRIYKKSGDINILRRKTYTTAQSPDN